MLRFKITITAPDQTRSEQLLFDRLPLRLGRAPENDLAIPYSSISGYHLTIDRHAQQGLLITDLGSTNGTRQANHTLTPHKPHPVSLPCELRLGDVRLSIAPIEPEPDAAFTCAHSETHLRELVDDALRQSHPDQENLPFFEILSGPGTGRRLTIDLHGQSAIFGTTPDAQVHLDLPDLPSEIAELQWKNDQLWLTSKLSEFLYKSQPITTPHPLQSGDRFILGAMEFLFFDPLEDALRVVTTGIPPILPSSELQGSPQQDSDATPALTVEQDQVEPNNEGPPIEAQPLPESNSHPQDIKPAAPSKKRPGLRPLELAILAISLLLLVGAAGFLWLFFSLSP